VGRAEPFHSITEAAINPLPDALIVSAPAPTFADVGVNPLNTGTGFRDPPPLQPNTAHRKRDSKNRDLPRISLVMFAPKPQYYHPEEK
jgi:hypothetical protein